MGNRYLGTVANNLGLTPCGLRVLMKAASRKDGLASGRGMGAEAAGARGKLKRSGFLDANDIITEAGRAAVRKARERGV